MAMTEHLDYAARVSAIADRQPLWHVAVTKQNQEKTAVRSLREQGFEFYFARTFERSLTDKRRRPVGSLLMAPYFYVRFDARLDEHGPLQAMRGVAEILRDASGEPLPLRIYDPVQKRSSTDMAADFIEQLRQAEDDEFFGGLEPAKAVRDDLRRGMMVRIVKPGVETRNAEGNAVPIEGSIALLDRKRVQVQAGNRIFTVDQWEVEPV